MLTIEAKQFGRSNPNLYRSTLPIPTKQTTLRDLLTEIVSAEVAAFHDRQRDRALFRVLTEQQINDGATSGKIDPADHAAQTVNLATAIDTAIKAFEDGLFFTFVDQAQIESLDTRLSLHEDSHITFLRLVALVGG